MLRRSVFCFLISLISLSCGKNQKSLNHIPVDDTLPSPTNQQSTCNCHDLTDSSETWYLKDSAYTGHCVSKFDNGNKESEADFSDGKMNGIYRTYFPNGNLNEEIEYKNGIPDGTVKYYYENGKLSEAGLVKENKKEGTWKVFYEDGNIMIVENYHENYLTDSTYSYYPDGRMEMKGYYEKGLAQGKWTFYDSLSGKVDGYLVYKDNKPAKRLDP